MEYDNYLMHYGRKNQKWGIRNFQNYDGTWTELGKARRRAMAGAGEAARKVKKVLKKTGKVTAATIKRTRKAISDASERSRKKRAIRDAKREEKIQKIVAKAIRKNDINTILKYSSHMDSNQLKDASARAGYIANLKKNMPEKKKSFAQKVAVEIGKYAVDNSKKIGSKAVEAAKNHAAKSNSKPSAPGNKQRMNDVLDIASIYDQLGYIPRKKKAKKDSVQDRLNKLYGWN